jgi:hypothetical protein
MLTEEIKEKLNQQGHISPKQMVSISEGLIVPEQYRTKIEYIYCQVYGIEPKRCKCGDLCTFINFKKGYSNTCGRRTECIYAKQDLISKMQATSMAKYGVANPMQSDVIKNKLYDSNMKKYGVGHCMQNPEVKIKVKATNIKRYGVENPLASKEVQAKVAETNKLKYGACNVFGSKAIKTKIKETNLKKYGVDNPAKSEQIKQKIKSTIQSKYGYSSYTSTEEYKQHMIDTFGVTNIAMLPEVKEKARKAKLLSTYDKILNQPNIDKIQPLFTKEEYEGSHKRSLYKWKCLRCGKEFEAYYWSSNHHLPLCPSCDTSTSLVHQELIEWLKSNNINVVVNDRKTIAPLELDIWLPQLNIAIEFNGTYWHSTYHISQSDYHINKLLRCKDKGIHLIHIWEYAWLSKKPQILHRLSSILNINQTRVFARNCTVKEISPEISKEFVDTYHLQGLSNASVNLGLYHKSELIAVMTFSKPRFNKTYQWELLRFCCSKYKVIGGASKLLKYFERNYNPKSLVSYADRCWTEDNNNLYAKLGMYLAVPVEKIKPNYKYVKGSTVLSRYQCQKHKLQDLLGADKFNPELSETENMINNGYYKLFDCGNLTYVKEYKDNAI